jgi:general stress protein 26
MSNTDDIRKLGDLIKDIKVAMMTTVDDGGALHSRPMMTQQTEFDGDLWFFSGLQSLKVHELQRDRHVNLSYAEPDDNRYVSVSGTAEVVQDRAKARQLWNPVYKAWFPKGLEDPDLGLVRVRVEKAEYWESPAGAVVQLVGFAKALASGERYQPGPGEHGKINV